MASRWTTAGSFNNRGPKAPRLDELVPMLEFTNPEEYSNIRLIGPEYVFGRHWIEVDYSKPGEEKKKPSKFPKMCVGFDSANGKASKDCPYCKLGLYMQLQIATNVIDRDLQENPPTNKGKLSDKEKKLVTLWNGSKGHVKDKASKLWTPLKVVVFSPTAAQKVQETARAVNKFKNKEGKKVPFAPNHPKLGFDITAKYDKAIKPATNAWFMQKTENTALTPAELAYPLWKLDQVKSETVEEAQKEVDRIKDKIVWRDAKKKIIKGKNKVDPDDADSSEGSESDDDGEFVDAGDDEAETSSKKPAAKKAAKKAVASKKPVAKKAPAAVKKGNKKPASRALPAKKAAKKAVASKKKGSLLSSLSV